jgi:hypothetical protein
MTVMSITWNCFAIALVFMVVGCGGPGRDKAESAGVDTTPAMVEGVYSDVAYSQESGDVTGTEVIVRRVGLGYMVSFQLSEGVPGRRSIVPVTVRSTDIEFTIPPDSGILVEGGVERPAETSPPRNFTGRVTAWGLRGIVQDWADSLLLPRKLKPYFPDSGMGKRDDG